MPHHLVHLFLLHAYRVLLTQIVYPLLLQVVLVIGDNDAAYFIQLFIGWLQHFFYDDEVLPAVACSFLPRLFVLSLPAGTPCSTR